MFWREVKGLSSVPLISKLTITVLLVVAGVGYLLGFANIYLTYSPVDRKPGLSLQDISLSFYGSRGGTKLEKSIDGSMRQYFTNDADYKAVKDWLASGAKESGFAQVQPIFDASCATCHSAEAAAGGAVLASYSGLAQLLAQDTGKSIPRLVSISHTHVLATLAVIFLLVFIFSFANYPVALKGVVMVFSSLAILLDIGSWWLAKLSPALSVLVIVGGILLALSFLALIVLSLIDLWFGKEAS